VVQPDLVNNGKKDDALPGYWRALDAIFVTVAIREEAELRISIQAKPKELPSWARPAFTNTVPASSLWQRFPENSILTIAAKTDFAGTADALKLIVPAKDRENIATDWKAGPGAILGMDPFKDILPNIGPDWGVCILPAKDPKELPRMMFALGAQPGSKDRKIDQMLLDAINLGAGFVIVDHNKNHPNSPIELKIAMQDKVQVKYLSSDRAFPAGIQPAYALKDGFLLLATSPDAIRDFQAARKENADPKETLLLRLSTRELGKLLDHRRAHIIASLTERQQMSEKDARKNVEDVISLLSLFERVTLSHRGDGGQASWIVRITPAK
jgi:hypothetical protein